MAQVSPLVRWHNFYVIVGSSAGALTGLQFVVIALIAQARAAGSMLEIRAFGTPTVVHFCSALLISAILTAPWDTLSAAALCLGLCGVAGVVYAARIIPRAQRQTGYQPDVEDWAWYAVIPLLAYAMLLASAILLLRHAAWSLFVVAATALLLLFVAIHNSWDTVTYVAVERFPNSKDRKDQQP